MSVPSINAYVACHALQREPFGPCATVAEKTESRLISSLYNSWVKWTTGKAAATVENASGPLFASISFRIKGIHGDSVPGK